MSRCRGGATCACAVQGTDGISVTGNGSASVPYIITLDLSSGSGACDQVMDCVGEHAGEGLAYDTSLHRLRVRISSDTANLTEFGSDDGIYTPPTVIRAGTATTITGAGTPENPYVVNTAPEVGDTALQAGDGITVTGTGITDDPYVISTDPAYATAALPATVNLTEAAWTQVDLGLQTAYPDTDVIDNGDGTITIVRPGMWQLNLTSRMRASASGPGCVYTMIQPEGLTSTWGGLTVPVTSNGQTMYSLGYTLTAPVAITTATVVRVLSTHSFYVNQAYMDRLDLSLSRLGPLPAATLAAPPAPVPPYLPTLAELESESV